MLRLQLSHFTKRELELLMSLKYFSGWSEHCVGVPVSSMEELFSHLLTNSDRPRSEIQISIRPMEGFNF